MALEVNSFKLQIYLPALITDLSNRAGQGIYSLILGGIGLAACILDSWRQKDLFDIRLLLRLVLLITVGGVRPQSVAAGRHIIYTHKIAIISSIQMRPLILSTISLYILMTNQNITSSIVNLKN